MTDFGNYKGYQGASRLQDGKSRATHIDDERLKIISESIVNLMGKDVLDVGCNTGYVTVQAALSYHARSVTGIDIDEELLDRARSHLSFRRSRIYCALPPSSALDSSSNIGDGGGGGGGGEHAKDRRQPQRPPPEAPRDRLNYFPISSIQKYGHLPAPPLTDSTSAGGGGEAINPILSNKHSNKSRSARTSHEQPSSASSSSSSLLKRSAAGERDPTADTIFPGRVEFKLEDWAAPGSENIVRGGGRVYDVILALSVVKWLHLEHGDQGLKTFFRNCRTSLRPDTGLLVIEIQGWDSYQKAVKKHKAPHLKGMLEKIEIHPEGGFDELLVGEMGFVFVGRWAGEGGMREIRVFRRGCV
ncbi:Bicoid-interacting protein 3-domain-containing protein [Peziza echinospora]|nr:Bicoid-interacting protein 3-domain-containing protein [Peziza echinospora]